MIMIERGFELYMWISFYCFLLAFTIILSAKLTQYFRRWGESKVDSLSYTSETLELPIENTFLTINCTIIKPPRSRNVKKILLVTPFAISAKRYTYLATALALNDYEVILIESRESSMKIQRGKIPNQEYATSLLHNVSPDAVVASDVFYSVFFQEMQCNSKIKYVFFRPILIKKQIRPAISLLFNIPWISNLIFCVRQLKRKNFPPIESEVLWIFPRVFLGRHRISKTYKNLTIQFFRARFSFRDKEAMIFTRILSFIGESFS